MGRILLPISALLKTGEIRLKHFIYTTENLFDA